jgi:hypothetical protein
MRQNVSPSICIAVSFSEVNLLFSGLLAKRCARKRAAIPIANAQALEAHLRAKAMSALASRSIARIHLHLAQQKILSVA